MYLTEMTIDQHIHIYSYGWEVWMVSVLCAVVQLGVVPIFARCGGNVCCTLINWELVFWPWALVRWMTIQCGWGAVYWIWPSHKWYSGSATALVSVWKEFICWFRVRGYFDITWLLVQMLFHGAILWVASKCQLTLHWQVAIWLWHWWLMERVHFLGRERLVKVIIATGKYTVFRVQWCNWTSGFVNWIINQETACSVDIKRVSPAEKQ